jgi:predicted glycoside hydrolase/deacetylase ChbG (UPF0249 family)
MKWLNVNADDFGMNAKRNAGIMEANRRGIVTSASILVYAPGFREAVRIAKAIPSLDLGLHLNLTEGEPVRLGHKTLVGEDGRFFGKEEARRRAAERLFDPDEVAAETEAQIDVLLEAGLKVTHLDGHQHIHVYGNLAEPIARAASGRGIRCFRSPDDHLVPPGFDDAARLAQVEEYRQAAVRSLPVYARARMRSTEHFGGVALSGILNAERLLQAIRDLPEGLTELMVHPGRAAAESGFDGPDRERELEALTDPRVRDLLREQKVQLTHFGKL